MLRYVFSCKLRAWASGKNWSDELILYDRHHSHIPRLSANMDAICWGRATIAKEPSNEHDPYAVAVLENVGGAAAGGSGCATRLSTVKPKDPSVAVASTAKVGVESWMVYQRWGMQATRTRGVV